MEDSVNWVMSFPGLINRARNGIRSVAKMFFILIKDDDLNFIARFKLCEIAKLKEIHHTHYIIVDILGNNAK